MDTSVTPVGVSIASNGARYYTSLRPDGGVSITLMNANNSEWVKNNRDNLRKMLDENLELNWSLELSSTNDALSLVAAITACIAGSTTSGVVEDGVFIPDLVLGNSESEEE